LSAAATAMRPGVNVVFGECRYIDDQSRVTWECQGEVPPLGPLTLPDWVVCWKQYPARQPSIFWRRAVQQAAGRLDESFQYAMDYDLSLRFAEKERFHQIRQTLSNFRLHAISKTVGQADRFVPEILRASRRYWGPPGSVQ